MENETMSFINMLSMSLTEQWNKLSIVLFSIEKIIKTGNENKSTEVTNSAKILPPVALQLLPLVEAFFVLYNTQGGLSTLPAITKTDSIMSSEEQPQPQQPGPSTSETTTTEVINEFNEFNYINEFKLKVNEEGNDEVRSKKMTSFVDKHRTVLNAFIRQTPNLLDGSLKPMLKVPRLIDFDNKRLYFRYLIICYSIIYNICS